MTFYLFQLARLDPHNIRSRVTDIDLLNFAVFVGGRDQGHGSALFPVWPGRPLTAADFNQGADLNGLPRTASHMTTDWTVGPVEVGDTEEVQVVYVATNTSDSQIPTADQQKVDEWTLRLANVYYSALLGAFVSEIGLTEVLEYAGIPGAVAAFLTDPVGTILGYRTPGSCNGTVFAGKRTFTGADLAATTVTPATFRSWGHEVKAWTADLSETLTDAATHDQDACGAVAETEVTLRITRLESWSLRSWSGRSLSQGLRPDHPAGGSLKRLYGLRL